MNPDDTSSAPTGRPPRPETTRAFLISGGYRKPVTTVHHYKTSRKVSVKDHKGVESTAWEHLFQCTRTGAIRRWGLDDVEAGGNGHATNGHAGGEED